MRMRGKKPLFSYKDTYDLDVVLSPIIAAALEKFLEVGRSEEYNHNFGIPASLVRGNEEVSQEEWFAIIEKMIYAFKAEEPAYRGGWSGLIEYDMMKPKYSPEWDDHIQEYEEHRKKVEEGLMLFGKFYNSLWW